MGSPDGVNVVALHLLEIKEHFPDRSVITGVRVAVVTVHALEFHGSAVYPDYPALSADRTEADLLAYNFITRRDSQVVEIWYLRRPELRVAYPDRNALAVPCGKLCNDLSGAVRKAAFSR